MAGSLFDTLQANVWNAVETVYGFDASWTPANGGPAHLSKVLFNYPTEPEKGYAGGTTAYEEPQWEMEYKDGSFPGLFESVNAAQVVETVVIDGTAYHVRSAVLDVDGKTIQCQLNPAPDL